VAFVDHLDADRFERRFESLADRLDTLVAHGRIWMNGSTSTEANAPSVV
jgi:hypothetical protein